MFNNLVSNNLESINLMVEFLKQLLFNTASQFFNIFGVFFLFGILLFFLARFTRKTFVKTVGYKFDVVITGWLGTPVHEIGHAVFCLIFMHKISEIKLYRPDAADGTIGYVNHTYNKKNIYHRIGNFFIGIGPILFGSLVLFLLLYFLLTDHGIISTILNRDSFSVTSLHDLKLQSMSILTTGADMIKLLFTEANFKNWIFWIFLYVSMCIASHMELSPADLKGALFGLISIVIIMLLINTIALLAGFNISAYAVFVNKQMGIVTGVFIFASLISLLNFVFSYVLFSIIYFIKKREFINPFWG